MGSRGLVGWIRAYHRRLIAGFVLLAAALIAIGYFTTPGVEELGHEQYAQRMCHDVLQPLGQVRVTAAADVDLQRFRDGSAVTTPDRERAIAAFATIAAELDRQTLAIAGFNDHTTLRGEDGRRFQLALNGALDRWSDAYAEAGAQIDTLDPDDEHLDTAMAGIEVLISGIVLDDGVTDLLTQLQNDLVTASPQCVAAVSSFQIASGS